MVDKIQFNSPDHNIQWQAVEYAPNPFVMETNAIREQMRANQINNSANDKSMESIESIESIAENIKNMAARIAELPGSVREHFVGLIEGMSGDQFPAYDALRTVMRKQV